MQANIGHVNDDDDDGVDMILIEHRAQWILIEHRAQWALSLLLLINGEDD